MLALMIWTASNSACCSVAAGGGARGHHSLCPGVQPIAVAAASGINGRIGAKSRMNFDVNARADDSDRVKWCLL
jgi:hypothetical protein